MKKILLPLMVIALSLVALPALAAEYYVDAENGVDGVGTPSCTTAENPCATITYTFAALNGGGNTMYLKGTFEEQLQLGSTEAGSEGAYTTITSWPGEEWATISPSAAFNININNSGYISISKLNVSGAGDTGVNIKNNCNNIILNQLNIYDNMAYGVRINTGSTIAVSNSIIFSSAGNQNTGIKVDGSATGVNIVNNTFYNNADRNIYLQLVSNINVYNNILASSAVAIELDSDVVAQGLLSDGNDFYNNTTDVYINNQAVYLSLAEWQASVLQDLNSLSEIDPSFASTTSGEEDLHLLSNSGVIDAGVDASSYTAVDFDGESRPYNAVYDIGADELLIPQPPTAIAASNQTASTATLSWTAPTTTTTSYTLEYSVNADYSNLTTVTGITSTSYDFTNLSANTTYYYNIYAKYISEFQGYNSTALTGSFGTAPIAPTNITASTRAAKKITLTWDIPTGTIVGYQIIYSTAEDFSNNMQTTVATANTAKISGLTANKAYYFAVFSGNGTLNSTASETLSARTKPAKIKNVKSLKKYLTSTSAKIKWQKPAKKAGLEYQVKLMDKKGKKIKTYQATKLNKLISKLTPATVYKVKVRAKYNKNNLGAWSKVVKFTTLAS